MIKNPSANAGDTVLSLGQEDSLEEEMATQSCILPWEIPWAVEPGRLQSMGSQRVGHDRVIDNTIKYHKHNGILHDSVCTDLFSHSEILIGKQVMKETVISLWQNST